MDEEGCVRIKVMVKHGVYRNLGIYRWICNGEGGKGVVRFEGVPGGASVIALRLPHFGGYALLSPHISTRAGELPIADLFLGIWNTGLYCPVLKIDLQRIRLHHVVLTTRVDTH